ncbi:hypothetical protein AAHH87_00485 [Candidatus Hodgkinia cicadicola]
MKHRIGLLKLSLCARSAKPVPPVSSALGQKRLNVPEFCNRFNELTKANEETEPLSVKLYIYSDRTYDITVSAPTLTCLVKRALALNRCSSSPGKLKVGVLARAEAMAIAVKKFGDMSASSISAGVKCVVASLRSMGVDVER